MRSLIATLVAAVILILLGVSLEALKWLLVIGLIALVASFVLGAAKRRQSSR